MAQKTVSVIFDYKPLKTYLNGLLVILKSVKDEKDVLRHLKGIVTHPGKFGQLIEFEQEPALRAGKLVIAVKPGHQFLKLDAALRARKGNLSITDIDRIFHGNLHAIE